MVEDVCSANPASSPARVLVLQPTVLRPPLPPFPVLDRNILLAALYNFAGPYGYDYLKADPRDMTPAEAAQVFATEGFGDGGTRVWDVRGRIIRSDFSEASPCFRLYDAAHGLGAASKVMTALVRGELPPIAVVDWDAEITDLIDNPATNDADCRELTHLRARLLNVPPGASVYAFDADACMLEGILVRRTVRFAEVLDSQGRIRIAISWRANGKTAPKEGQALLAAAGFESGDPRKRLSITKQELLP